MPTLTRAQIDAMNDWEALAQLEHDLRGMVEYARRKKDLQRARAHGLPTAEALRAVEDLRPTVPVSVTW
jgi:hypothetical protein